MGTHIFLPKCSKYRAQQTKLLQSDAYNVHRLAVQQIESNPTHRFSDSENIASAAGA